MNQNILGDRGAVTRDERKGATKVFENSPCLVPLLRAADAFRVTWSEPKISPWGLPGAEADELSLRILYSPGKIPRT